VIATIKRSSGIIGSAQRSLWGGGAGANDRLVDQLAADGSTRRHRRRARAVTQAFGTGPLAHAFGTGPLAPVPVAQARWRMPAVAGRAWTGIPGRAP